MDLGLTPKQVEVYVGLLRVGVPLSAAEVAEIVGIHRTGVYRILSELENMGLIRTTPGRPAHFAARPIGEAVGSLVSIELERIYSSAMEALNFRAPLWSDDSEFRLGIDLLTVRGARAVKTLLLDLIRSAQKRILILKSGTFEEIFRSVEGELRAAREAGIEVILRTTRRVQEVGGASSDSGWTILALPSSDGGIVAIASSREPTSGVLKKVLASLSGANTFIHRRGI